MPYHDWSEKDFDWKGLEECVDIIYTTCVTWGRLGGQAKEKFGQVRFYAQFGYLSLHRLIYPGYHYNQFPQWLWKLDCFYISRVLQFFFERPFVWWQKKVYNFAYQRALAKHPHLRDEILCCADYPEFIKNEKNN